ncbi:class II fructose-1,6-bisphosphate aldolase [Mycoplasma marinum]|uniref:Fructose-1,6-bisphosphate aldolase, class II n=1 Tax=Mycoplasma marinum TaxID=1937190 RepID=A0A4R0XTG0_9MOLU|nr:class II fructose-1,6-bisphosphate aldolase [Mycoplasma marinum]TCG10919.1 fructose-1,6-bisphosphate aldolase, class II [Mycoplasma marinum]
MSRLVNMAEMTRKAYEGKYAVPHININNLEWTKAVLTAAQELNSPIILGTSEGAVKYMGGMNTIVGMVNGLVEDMDITVPVTLHLDHGSFEGAKKAIEAGYTSIMYDGSHSPFEENYANSKELIALAKAKGMSMEAEVGTLAGEEDGIIGEGDKADPKEASKMAALGINVLAAGIGNIHGPYPAAWKSLDFAVLKEISAAAGMGIVLHGGSGIPADQISKAISLGVAKINVNTELQLVNAKATAEYVRAGGAEDMANKGFDPRKLLKPGFEAMVEMSKAKIKEFGSANKA